MDEKLSIVPVYGRSKIHSVGKNVFAVFAIDLNELSLYYFLESDISNLSKTEYSIIVLACQSLQKKFMILKRNRESVPSARGSSRESIGLVRSVVRRLPFLLVKFCFACGALADESLCSLADIFFIDLIHSKCKRHSKSPLVTFLNCNRNYILRLDRRAGDQSISVVAKEPL